MAGAIENSGNLTGDADAAGGVLIEFSLTGLGYDYLRHFAFSRFLKSGTVFAAAPFVMASGQ
jgi:hypothetical protein